MIIIRPRTKSQSCGDIVLLNTIHAEDDDILSDADYAVYPKPDPNISSRFPTENLIGGINTGTIYIISAPRINQRDF